MEENMGLNKKIIKRIATLLIVLVIFTFSVVLATDDSIYVWSAETELVSNILNNNVIQNQTSPQI